MKLILQGSMRVGNSLSVKKQKDAVIEAEVIAAAMDFREMFLTREQSAFVLGLKESHIAGLWGADGSPRAPMQISTKRTLHASLKITREGAVRLDVPVSELSNAELSVAHLGCLLACKLTWRVRGDEAEDVERLLGAAVDFQMHLSDEGQQMDAFRDVKREGGPRDGVLEGEVIEPAQLGHERKLIGHDKPAKKKRTRKPKGKGKTP
jgi:hypothetical protein